MLNRFSYRKKNYILLAITGILIIASWQLALEKTVDAIALNKELDSGSEDQGKLAFNPTYLKQKQQLLEDVLKKYTINQAEWTENFWFKISRVAAANDIGVYFHPQDLQGLEPDSSSVISRQHIAFEGSFKNMLSFLDSIQKTEQMGYITSAVFKKEVNRQQVGQEKLRLEMVFSIVKE